MALSEALPREAQTKLLVFRTFRMHQRQVEKISLLNRRIEVKSSLKGGVHHLNRQCISGKGVGSAPKHISGKLVKQQDQRERSFHAFDPGLRFTQAGRSPGLLETFLYQTIKIRIRIEPAIRRCLLESKIEYFTGIG